MQTIREVVEKIVEQLKTHSFLEEKEIEILLKKFLTAKEFKHIKYIFSKNNILYIEVDSWLWLVHLNLKKDELLEDLKEKLNLKDIKFLFRSR